MHTQNALFNLTYDYIFCDQTHGRTQKFASGCHENVFDFFVINVISQMVVWTSLMEQLVPMDPIASVGGPY